ncbi:C-type mannose receptor 2-like [Trematomus bernacchii]|uniref:C-type mannose receptor 2-like n=1 Tax=Trematomus bernacchii TaxID=40690 RepID=UPI00146C680F|nr:C-type mannose receptor 2-like [Trematomus bernacchii]
MEKVLLIIIALSGLSAVSSHAERQYHFVSEAKTMSEAQRYCREKHTDLATVDSMEVVELLNNMAGQYNQSAWIGLHDDRDTWRWSMSDPSFYGPGETEFRPWGTGQPSNCQAVCCGASTQLLWGPFSGPNATFVLINSAMTWPEAQSYCREHHTDLASVRNLTENQQIVELVSGGNHRYWIGLYRDSWKWSDGSNSSFKYWKVNQPNYVGLKACVAAAFDNSGEWEDLDCGVKKPFICYGPVPVVPVSMKVIKVSVENPNGVDLNDPAFLYAMLVEAKKKLRAQGLDDNVQLVWRKQPDGQVFHKEEEEKKRDESPTPKSAWKGLYEDVVTWRWSLSDPSFYKPGEMEFRHGGPNVIFLSTDGVMTWTEAQSYCREHHTDLASVRNPAEEQQIVELLPGGIYWIGLYRDSWKWSDGSFSSFKYWAVNEPKHRAFKVCVAAAFHDSGKWEGLYCGLKKPFICYGQTYKPDALSRRFAVDHDSTVPDTIIPATRVVGAVTWEIESSVRNEQKDQPDPGNSPDNRRT